MMRVVFILFAGLVFNIAAGAAGISEKENARKRPVVMTWGDQGNGTYVNPVLNADYSDPDVIRVGDKYYMIASDFHFMGMQVLESDDLVNWTIISQIYDRFDFPEWERNARYSGGAWAPAIRYHDGKFWVYFCTPDEGLFMSQATDPRGPWSPLHLVKNVAKWEDPCPFWDEDGQAYLGHSKWGAGPIIIHKMSPDGKTLLDDGVTVYTGPVAEGTKIHKFNGYYYLSIPEGGVSEGWQTVLRSRNIYGPYEKKVVLEQGMTGVNGPHQGAIIDTPEGEWWFLHFQEFSPIGRVVHLQPMHWHDGWPVIGVDQNMNGIGEPVFAWRKPGWSATARNTDLGEIRRDGSARGDRHLPAHNDEFNTSALGLQWQFNHNPVDEAWSLTEKNGWLTLHSLPAQSFKMARNTVTQKCMGYIGEFTTKMDASSLVEGDCAGLACMGKYNHMAGVMKKDGKLFVYMGNDKEPVQVSKPVSGKNFWFRLQMDAVSVKYQFSYSTDGKTFVPVGGEFEMRSGYWKGVRPSLFCYNTTMEGGCARFDWARYDIFDDVITAEYEQK